MIATTTFFEKQIRYDRETRDYRMLLDGRCIGYASTYHEAEVTLDQVVYEMLTHGHVEFGLDDIRDALGRLEDEQCDQDFAQPQPDEPVECASWSTAPTASADPPPDDGPGDDCPDHGPYGDDDCPKCGAGYGRAASLALQALLDAQKKGKCLNCGGVHKTWACPEIHQTLFAPEPWKDIALGRELCRMRWVNFSGFVTLLREVRDHGHLTAYAASYQAYFRSYSPDTTMTIDQVLAAWGRMLSGEQLKAA